jgi:hypothetical protein
MFVHCTVAGDEGGDACGNVYDERLSVASDLVDAIIF